MNNMDIKYPILLTYLLMLWFNGAMGLFWVARYLASDRSLLYLCLAAAAVVIHAAAMYVVLYAGAKLWVYK